jgi:hypothetical protein
MVLQNYQKYLEMPSKMICIVALGGGGFKCPCKIHLNIGDGGSITISAVMFWVDVPANFKLLDFLN